VLQALQEGGERKAQAAVARVRRQVRRQAEALERCLARRRRASDAHTAGVCGARGGARGAL